MWRYVVSWLLWVSGEPQTRSKVEITRQSMHEFDGDTWKYNALMDYVAFNELSEFIGNNAALDAHAGSYAVTGDTSAFSQAQLDSLRTAKIETLEATLSHFGSQTVISLCTTFEVCVREYFRALFLVKPQAMFDFLGSEDSRGHIPLKEILQVSSYQDLLARLAHTASGTASKGKYGQVYARALSRSGTSGSKAQTEKLNALQFERNKFIHERHRPTVSLEVVRSAHLVVDDAIQGLCKAGVDVGLPGRFTCVNPEIQLIVESVVLDVRRDG